MTQIKICGLTRREDVELACALGASYVGFVFAEQSPRRVSAVEARGLSSAVAPGVARVGIFVDEEYEAILAAIDAARLDLVQVHRVLREEDLERIPTPIVSVARVTGGVARVPAPELLARCRALLFDTAERESGGGSGARFDWRLLEGKSFPVPLFLAGGLDAETVGAAIARVRPAAVDVATGVESSPGVKDRGRLERFFQAVEKADARTDERSP